MPIGPTELIIIGVIVLLIFGPKRLPQLAKGLGKGIRDFKKAVEGKDEETAELPPSESKKPIDVTTEKNVPDKEEPATT